MYPYLNTPFGTWEAYDVMGVLGAVLSVFTQMVMLYMGTRQKRCILFAGLYGLYSWLGGYVGSLVRQTSYGKQIEGNLLEHVALGEGKHYLGIVLVSTILCVPCTRLLCLVLHLKREQWRDTEKVVRNALSVGILLHHICVRLGCFCRGCCYGKYYNGIFCVRMSDGTDTYPVFPSQLLEAGISALFLIAVGILIAKKKDVFGIVLLGYAANIFITEFFMDQKGAGMVWGVTILQWWALALFLCGIFYCIMTNRRRRE